MFTVVLLIVNERQFKKFSAKHQNDFKEFSRRPQCSSILPVSHVIAVHTVLLATIGGFSLFVESSIIGTHSASSRPTYYYCVSTQLVVVSFITCSLVTSGGGGGAGGGCSSNNGNKCNMYMGECFSSALTDPEV
jgi:hypothetical protein